MVYMDNVNQVIKIYYGLFVHQQIKIIHIDTLTSLNSFTCKIPTTH